MPKYRWTVSHNGHHEVVLDIKSNRSWFAWKSLFAGGLRIYHRGPLAGVDAIFTLPGTNRSARLVNEPVPDSPNWRPALYVEGQRQRELTTDIPEPTLVPRPPALSFVVGLTLLLMFICLTSFSAIEGVASRITGEPPSAIRARWVLPLLLSAPCLGGYWVMRCWGPILYALVLAVQVALHVGGRWEMSNWALGYQAILVVFGFAYFRRMH